MPRAPILNTWTIPSSNRSLNMPASTRSIPSSSRSIPSSSRSIPSSNRALTSSERPNSSNNNMGVHHPHGSLRAISNRKFAVVKNVFGFLLVALGYYYFASESMLDKYSTPASFYSSPRRQASAAQEYSSTYHPPSYASSDPSSGFSQYQQAARQPGSTYPQHSFALENVEEEKPKVGPQNVAVPSAISAYQRKHQGWKKGNEANAKLRAATAASQEEEEDDNRNKAKGKPELDERHLEAMALSNARLRAPPPNSQEGEDLDQRSEAESEDSEDLFGGRLEAMAINAYQKKHQDWKKGNKANAKLKAPQEEGDHQSKAQAQAQERDERHLGSLSDKLGPYYKAKQNQKTATKGEVRAKQDEANQSKPNIQEPKNKMAKVSRGNKPDAGKRGTKGDDEERGPKPDKKQKIKQDAESSMWTKKEKTTKKQTQAATDNSNNLPSEEHQGEITLPTADADISYVHYTGCCGMGHRLARMSNAFHASKRLNFAIKGTWPSCNKTNVYEYLFEDDSHEWSSKNYTRSSQAVKVNNEVPGYATVSRAPPSKRDKDTSTCDTCHSAKIDSDYQFYTQLLQRFRKRDQVHAFLKQHQFDRHTVIGMHTRAGNGEGGDFENKNRGIANTTHFVEQVRQHVLSLVKEHEREWKDPPLLFLATDTASMVDLFRSAMVHDGIPIVELPQIRATEGAGILFGDKKSRERRKSLRAEKQQQQEEEGKKELEEAEEREQCLRGWDQAFMDMMLLASADLVVATRRSSFVQTIPLSIVMARENRKVRKPYCEVSQDSALKMTCHESYMDWCCCHECVAQEEKERRKEKKRRNGEYVKQFRSDLWDTPVRELYAKQMKPTEAIKPIEPKPDKFWS